jgi:ribosomal protein S18 acetylase RimI-like enzyme
MPEIVPFTDDHLDAAARLLADRHRRHREPEPLLPERYEDATVAVGEVATAWRRDRASGAAAVADGDLVGYLIGAPRDDEVWGPNIWVEAGGYAAVEPETVRDLYAAAAEHWVDEGRTRHYGLVPATDAAAVDSWFRLCFGQQHAHAVRELPATTDAHVPDGIEIRDPSEGEIERLIDIDLALTAHQRRSPVFSNRPLPTREESRAEWLSTFVSGEEKLFVAYRDGEPVACWAVVPMERLRELRGLMAPDSACYLGFASTLPEARGTGVGVALTEACFDWAAGAGYAAMATDWRVTNLLASHFWPRRGFRPAFLRLYRSIP